MIEATGAVLWRPATDGPEIALVHRPKYDDWSLPKGKLDRDEHPLLGALREVREETGFAAVIGRPLGETRYTVPEGPKRVRYWAARATDGMFAPGREVDELRWLSPTDALGLLSADRDADILHAFLADTRPAAPLVVVRHASAGHRRFWSGEDRERPLDERGQRQAQALATVLAAYDVRTARTADCARCRQTLEPFTGAAGIDLVAEPRIEPAAFEADPDAAVRALVELAATGQGAVLCAQREVIPDVVAGTCSALGCPTGRDEIGEVPRGSFVVLHVHRGDTLLAREWLPAPA